MNANEQNSDYLQMIRYATKAPSGHNVQPWLFGLEKDSIIITPDFRKTLPVVDPNNRELFISLGCATENLCLAASAYQYHTEVAVSHEGVITIHLKKSEDAIPDPLFEQIETRQTNRRLYNGKGIAEEVLLNILQECSNAETQIHAWAKDTPEFNKLAHFVTQGNTIQMNDVGFKKELLSWIRFNRSHVEATNDGLSYAVMGAPGLPKLISKCFVVMALNSKLQNRADLKKITTSSHLLLLTTKENTIVAWIMAGRVLQRLLLTLTKNNIAMAYLNQPCEVDVLNRQMEVALPIGQQKPQILIRIGYGKPMPYSERKKVSAVMTN